MKQMLFSALLVVSACVAPLQAEPLGLAVSYSDTLTARNDLPLNSLREVVAYARANPGKLTYASAGAGSGQHVLDAADPRGRHPGRMISSFLPRPTEVTS